MFDQLSLSFYLPILLPTPNKNSCLCVGGGAKTEAWTDVAEGSWVTRPENVMKYPVYVNAYVGVVIFTRMNNR